MVIILSNWIIGSMIHFLGGNNATCRIHLKLLLFSLLLSVITRKDYWINYNILIFGPKFLFEQYT